METHDVDLARLSALARGLSGIPDITVILGNGSYFNPDDRILSIDKGQVGSGNVKRANALCCHEVGHVYLSRYPSFRPQIDPEIAWWHLNNGLEDAMVNLWTQKRFPGTSAWFEALAADAPLAQEQLPPSHLLRFIYGCCLLNRSTWEADAPGLKPRSPEFLALRTTRAARQAYCEATPPPDLKFLMPPEHVALPLQDDQDFACSPQEVMVRSWASFRLSIVVRDILPEARRLIFYDLDRIADFCADGAASALLSFEDESGDGLLSLVREALENRPTATPGTFVALPKKDQFKLRNAYASYLKNEPPTPRWVLDPRAASRGRGHFVEISRLRHSGFPGHSGDSADLLSLQAKIAPQVAQVTRSIGTVLRPLSRDKWQRNQITGPRIDLARLIQFEAVGRDARIFQRRLKPKHPDAAVMLLVDLSGSMAGAKAEAATGAALLLAEALARNNVDYNVTGFQDVLIPFANFGDGWNDYIRNRIGEMSLEVVGRRPGGNNSSGCNDDGPCLSEAAEILLRQPRRQRLLIVISDGRPSGRRSDSADLHRAIAALEGRKSELSLIAIGAGPETGHVKDFYGPISIADVPLDRLGEEIGRLLLRLGHHARV